MKIVRLLLGAMILCVSLWVIVGEQISGASADAVVNAQLSTLRTRVAGTVSLNQRALGSRVAKGEELGSVFDPLVDTVRLDELLQQRDLAKADTARLASVIAATEATIATLAERAKVLNAAQISDLQIQLDNARVRFGLLTGQTQAIALAKGAKSDPGLALNSAAERVGLLEEALRSAKSGTPMRGDDGGASAIGLRLIDLGTTLAGLTAEATAATARQDILASQVVTEQVRNNREGALTLVSNVNGMVWEYLAADGETLMPGHDVMRFVDCDSVIVTASVPENVYRHLSAGQSSVFRMNGDSLAYPATITRLAGVGAQVIYRNLAVAPSQRHLERFDVTLLVPALRDASGGHCAIGRTGRVFFDSRPLDWLRGLWR